MYKCGELRPERLTGGFYHYIFFTGRFFSYFKRTIRFYFSLLLALFVINLTGGFSPHIEINIKNKEGINLKSPFVKGLYHGLPIALGYLSVSFGFGIMAVRAGLSILAAVGISVTNLTSAGQAAGVGIIAAGGSLFEMALTEFVINMRYGLMGISLSQKLDGSFNTARRLIVAYGITDEIYAVAISQKEKITAKYMYGLILISFLGWSSGTLIGAAAGEVLPKSVTDAMGIVLYGMFIAIIVPAAKKEKSVLLAITVASVLSILFRYVLTFISGGFAVIISAVAASAVVALIFPVKDNEDETDSENAGLTETEAVQ